MSLRHPKWILAAALASLAVHSCADVVLGSQDWGDSPFLAERGGPKPTVMGQAASGEEVFVLKGILWDARSPSAIVNDRVVSPGDQLGRWRVVEIQKNQVILSDGTSTQELRAR